MSSPRIDNSGSNANVPSSTERKMSISKRISNLVHSAFSRALQNAIDTYCPDLKETVISGKKAKEIMNVMKQVGGSQSTNLLAQSLLRGLVTQVNKAEHFGGSAELEGRLMACLYLIKQQSDMGSDSPIRKQTAAKVYSELETLEERLPAEKKDIIKLLAALQRCSSDKESQEKVKVVCDQLYEDLNAWSNYASHVEGHNIMQHIANLKESFRK